MTLNNNINDKFRNIELPNKFAISVTVPDNEPSTDTENGTNANKNTNTGNYTASRGNTNT